MVARKHVNLLLGAAGVTWLDKMVRKAMHESGPVPTRSSVIRASLAVARRHEDEVLEVLKGQV